MNSNLKDTITNICGIIFVICTALLTATASGLILPLWITTASGILVAVSGGLIGYFTGKAPSGLPKTPGQVANANTEIDPPIPPKG